MPQIQPLPVTKGRKTKLFCAYRKDGDRSKPSSVSLTMTALAAKGATSITITAPTLAANEMIHAGQSLLFVDADSKVYIATVNANYTTGTSLTVKPLPEAIPTASVAAYPAPFKLRVTADISISTDTVAANTYDHGVNGDASPGSTSFTVSLDGEYSPYDPGYATCAEAQRTSNEVYFIRELANPGSGFTKGKVTQGAGIVTSRSEPAPNVGNVSASIELLLVGDVDEALPVPTV